MLRATAIVGVLALGAVFGSAALHATPRAVQAGTSSGSASTAEVRQFFDTYCVSCHNEKRKANYANLALDSVDVTQLGAHAAALETVIRKLRVGAMPPVGSRRPGPDTYAKIIASLEQGLDRAAIASPNPGRVPIHRLNRLQYVNAIRDLFGIEIEASMLPADNTGYGFDNIADVLTMSPGLLDRYLVAAAKVSRLVVREDQMRPAVTSYTLPYLSLGQDQRMAETLPFGSRGGTAITHYFPADGEYTATIFIQRTSLAEGAIPRGLDAPSRIDVRLDREPLRVFTIGGMNAIPGSSNDAPKVYQGVGDPYDPQEGLTLRFRASAGKHTIGISFNQDRWMTEGTGTARLPLGSTAFSQGRLTTVEGGRIETGLDRVDVAGPFKTAPVDRTATDGVFVCRPASAPGAAAGRPAATAPDAKAGSTGASEEACATRILQRLARRAFRRPVTKADTDSLLAFYRAGRKDGSFDAGIRAAIEAMLVDLNFLFVLERDPAGVKSGMPYRISDMEFASRLSLFLWSSIPDDELLTLAAKGTLRAPGVLERQVRRMLADPRSVVFRDSFFGQWLTTRNVASHRPDSKAYPQFDDNLRAAFQEETRLFLEDQVVSDRPALELFTADYTFANERLARHYGIPNVYGNHFRRVALPGDTRGGLLGQGSVLMVTSYVDRTSVVLRGKWILENLLGIHPPPPPENIPPLEATKIAGTLRQRMEQHRKNAVCAGCHSVLDPLGFALENFDGVGTYRTTDGGAPVNPSGVLVDGTKFEGPATFRQALVRYESSLLTTLVDKMLTYALGRGTEPYDMPAVRQVIREAAPAQYRWSALVLGIVKSAPFQMRRSES
jgi:mono/diheme cytochrome c family protein